MRDVDHHHSEAGAFFLINSVNTSASLLLIRSPSGRLSGWENIRPCCTRILAINLYAIAMRSGPFMARVTAVRNDSVPVNDFWTRTSRF